MPFQCATRNKGKCKDINLCQQFKLQFKQFGNINVCSITVAACIQYCTSNYHQGQVATRYSLKLEACCDLILNKYFYCSTWSMVSNDIHYFYCYNKTAILLTPAPLPTIPRTKNFLHRNFLPVLWYGMVPRTQK